VQHRLVQLVADLNCWSKVRSYGSGTFPHLAERMTKPHPLCHPICNPAADCTLCHRRRAISRLRAIATSAFPFRLNLRGASC